MSDSNSTPKPDGGPAFPKHEQWNEWSELKGNYIPRTGPRGGMSLRDYFAAHASRTPQHWFRPVMPTPPPVKQRHEGHGELRGCVDDICPILNWDEVNAYNAERERQTFLQWPYAWADAMIAERAK